MENFQKRKWKIEDVSRFKANLETSHLYTAREYENLKVLSMVYNREYPTDYAKYLSTAQKLMSKMRSTLASFKQIAGKFHPRKKRGSRPKAGVSSFDCMTLYCKEYSCDMFGWEAYSDRMVKDLLNELNRYLKLACKCLDLCLQVIKEEKAVRANPEVAYSLYIDSFHRSVCYNHTLINQMIQKGQYLESDLSKTLSEAEDVKQLIADWYHKLNRADFNYYCACAKVNEGRKDGLSAQETLLFGENSIKKVKRIRTLLDHIAELCLRVERHAER